MLLFALLVGCNDCSYWERCDGDTLLVCGASVDQLYNRQIYRQPCDGPNPVCVEVGHDDATCAPTDEPCDKDAPDTCDGDAVYTCRRVDSLDVQNRPVVAWYLWADDCGELDQVCSVDRRGFGDCVDPTTGSATP